MTQTRQNLCRRCRTRCIQSWRGPYAGLCRTCAGEIAQETGAPLPTTREIEATRLAMRARHFSGQKVQDTGPRPSPVRIIDGVAYDVNWDGS